MSSRPPRPQSPEEPEPRLAAHDLSAIFALRNSLVDQAAFGHYHADLSSGDAYAALVDDLAAHLKGRGVGRDAVFDSCRDLAGREATVEALSALAWRLAGNLGRLRAGRPAYAWSAQREPEWMPLEILMAEPGRDRYDNPGCWYTFQVLAGTACPLRVKKFWSRAQSKFFAGEELGFVRGNSRRRPMPFSHPLQLVRLRLHGLFTPALSRDRPGFKRIRVTPSALAHNTAVLKVRFRHDPCPLAYAHPCHRCSHGYMAGDRPCRAATHPTQWYAADCTGCGREGQAFDDTSRSRVCIECTTRRSMARKNEDG